MAVHPNPAHLDPAQRKNAPQQPAPPAERTHWPGYIQFLFVAGLTALFILLAVSMQRNHFLDGALDHPEQHAADQ